MGQSCLSSGWLRFPFSGELDLRLDHVGRSPVKRRVRLKATVTAYFTSPWHGSCSATVHSQGRRTGRDVGYLMLQGTRSRDRADEGRALHSLLHRRLFPGSRHRDPGAAREARLLGRVSARSNLLRAADGQQRLPGRCRRHRGPLRPLLQGFRHGRRAVRQLRPPRPVPPRRRSSRRPRPGRSGPEPVNWSSSCTTT